MYRKRMLAVLAVLVLLFCCACSEKTASNHSGVSTSASETSDQAEETQPEDAEEKGAGIGSLPLTNIDGSAEGDAWYQDHKLTLVNIMATWCSPCIAEMPELEQISREMADAGVGVAGVVIDTRDASSGETDEEALAAAAQLRELTEVTYPLLVPDDTFLDGLAMVQVVPTTYFVDSEGYIVAGPVEGARDEESWKEIIDALLTELS